MTRTVPSLVLENPGVLINGLLWNNGPKATGDFMSGIPLCRVHQNTAQSTSSGSYHVFGFDASNLDTDSGHSTSVNNSRYVCQVPGWYWVQGIATWVNTGSQSRSDAVIAKNGTVVNGSHQALLKPASDYMGLVAQIFIRLQVGDYVELWGMQNTGSTINTGVFSDLDPSFCVTWIHY